MGYKRRTEGASVCVKVIIENGEINLTLATAACFNSAGRRRKLTKLENDVVNLWNKLHLNEVNFTSGNLFAFNKQVYA